MNSEIKQRIEKLNKGEIPDGYKKNEFGVFPCDWVTDKTFDDLFNFFGGLSKSRDQLGDEGYAYLHYGDLHRGSFNKVSLEPYEQLPKCDITLTGKETCLMEDGDVAFLDASEDLEGTSRAVLIDNPDDKPFIAGLHIIYGKSKDDSLEKWYKQYITSSESVKKQFQRLAVGFKVYGVNRDTLPKIHVAYPPSLQEQSRIAEILMKWDEAIELYNKQIELLTQYKAVCLKKMFPSKGKNVPEWRFKGFTDAWEQRKVIDVAPLQRGFDLPTSQMEEGPYPVVMSNGIGGYHSAYKANGPGVVTGRSGTIGKLHYIEDNYWPHNTALWVTDFKGNLPRFVFYLYQRLNLSYFGSGSGVPTLNRNDIHDAKVYIPSVEEQVKISNVLDGIDRLITLHQRKLEIIQHQRKVLQQYLLNGIVRVKHE